MILYGSTLSPFVRKVMAFAAEKGVALDLQPGGLGRGGEEFAAASPFGKIPALRVPGADDGKDFCLADSTAIITYLEACFPSPDLIPAGPMARGRAIWFDEFADTIFFAVAAKIFANRVLRPKLLKTAFDESVADAAEADELPPLFDYLEQVIPPSGFLIEDRITLADIAVCSPFANLGHGGVSVDAARWPRTAAYVAAILARPSFATMIAKEQAFIAAAG